VHTAPPTAIPVPSPTATAISDSKISLQEDLVVHNPLDRAIERPNSSTTPQGLCYKPELNLT
jgi:hypothetical protein